MRPSGAHTHDNPAALWRRLAAAAAVVAASVAAAVTAAEWILARIWWIAGTLLVTAAVTVPVALWWRRRLRHGGDRFSAQLAARSPRSVTGSAPRLVTGPRVVTVFVTPGTPESVTADVLRQALAGADMTALPAEDNR